MSGEASRTDASDSRIIDGGTSVLPDVIEVRHGPWGLDERRTTYVAVDALRLEHRDMNRVAALWHERSMFTNGARSYDSQRLDRIIDAILKKLGAA